MECAALKVEPPTSNWELNCVHFLFILTQMNRIHCKRGTDARLPVASDLGEGP